jgi:hypothetical protein
MIKTRIAGTAAVLTFGLAALGGTALAVAAPSNAAPSNEHGAGSTSTSAPDGGADKSPRQAHLIPHFKPQPTQPTPAHLIPGFKPQQTDGQPQLGNKEQHQQQADECRRPHPGC